MGMFEGHVEFYRMFSKLTTCVIYTKIRAGQLTLGPPARTEFEAAYAVNYKF